MKQIPMYKKFTSFYIAWLLLQVINIVFLGTIVTEEVIKWQTTAEIRLHSIR